MRLPMTASDLRSLAEAVEKIEDNRAIVDDPCIGDIELRLPGADEVVGHIVRSGMNGNDDWMGFVPAADS